MLWSSYSISVRYAIVSALYLFVTAFVFQFTSFEDTPYVLWIINDEYMYIIVEAVIKQLLITL